MTASATATADVSYGPGTAARLVLSSGETIDVSRSFVLVAAEGTPGWRGVPHLLTVDQVAELLGIGEWKVRELARTGQLRSITIGSCRRFRPVDVNAYVDARLTPTGRARKRARSA